MNTFKFIAAAVLMGSFVMSCENTPNNKSKESTETVVQDAHDHNNTSETLKLNNGDKWRVNEEMKPYILESEAILNQYVNENGTDYKVLAERLNEKNSGLIQSCTMKGASHDELHLWLHPHMELIKALGKAENADQSKPIVADLKQSFNTYKQYFQ